MIILNSLLVGKRSALGTVLILAKRKKKAMRYMVYLFRSVRSWHFQFCRSSECAAVFLLE